MLNFEIISIPLLRFNNSHFNSVCLVGFHRVFDLLNEYLRGSFFDRNVLCNEHFANKTQTSELNLTRSMSIIVNILLKVSSFARATTSDKNWKKEKQYHRIGYHQQIGDIGRHRTYFAVVAVLKCSGVDTVKCNYKVEKLCVNYNVPVISVLRSYALVRSRFRNKQS